MSSCRLAVFQFDLNALEQSGAVDDAVELAVLASEDMSYDEVLISVAGLKIDEGTIDRMVSGFGVGRSACVRSHKSFGLLEGTVLAVNLVACLKEVEGAVVFDGNRSEVSEVLHFGPGHRNSALWTALRELDAAHEGRHLGGCVRALKSAVERLEGIEGDVASEVRTSLRHLIRLLGSHYELLLGAGRQWDPRMGTGIFAIRSFQLGARLEVMSRALKGLDGGVCAVDVVRGGVSFFGLGATCIGGLGSTYRPSRLTIRRALVWYCVYLFAAAKEESNEGRSNLALLLSFRALEVFMLAYLMDVRRVDVGRSGVPILNGRSGPRFVDVWKEFCDCAPNDFVEGIEPHVNAFSNRRNENVLTHGFRDADGKVVEAVRSCVRRVMAHWDEQYVQGAGLAKGPLAEFSRGEKWSGDLGKTVAVGLLDKLAI